MALRTMPVGGLLAAVSLFSPSRITRRGENTEPSPATDAREAIAGATTCAHKKHRHLLVVWGQDASERDLDLYEALRAERTEEWHYNYEFVITPVHS